MLVPTENADGKVPSLRRDADGKVPSLRRDADGKVPSLRRTRTAECRPYGMTDNEL